MLFFTVLLIFIANPISKEILPTLAASDPSHSYSVKLPYGISFGGSDNDKDHSGSGHSSENDGNHGNSHSGVKYTGNSGSSESKSVKDGGHGAHFGLGGFGFSLGSNKDHSKPSSSGEKLHSTIEHGSHSSKPKKIGGYGQSSRLSGHDKSKVVGGNAHLHSSGGFSVHKSSHLHSNNLHSSKDSGKPSESNDKKNDSPNKYHVKIPQLPNPANILKSVKDKISSGISGIKENVKKLQNKIKSSGSLEVNVNHQKGSVQEKQRHEDEKYSVHEKSHQKSKKHGKHKGGSSHKKFHRHDKHKIKSNLEDKVKVSNSNGNNGYSKSYSDSHSETSSFGSHKAFRKDNPETIVFRERHKRQVSHSSKSDEGPAKRDSQYSSIEVEYPNVGAQLKSTVNYISDRAKGFFENLRNSASKYYEKFKQYVSSLNDEYSVEVDVNKKNQNQHHHQRSNNNGGHGLITVKS